MRPPNRRGPPRDRALRCAVRHPRWSVLPRAHESRNRNVETSDTTQQGRLADRKWTGRSFSRRGLRGRPWLSPAAPVRAIARSSPRGFEDGLAMEAVNETTETATAGTACGHGRREGQAKTQARPTLARGRNARRFRVPERCNCATRWTRASTTLQRVTGSSDAVPCYETSYSGTEKIT